MRTEATVLKDGVYIGLAEEEYFRQPCLGSTDLAKLYQVGRGWWWQSRHNPANESEPTKSMTFGRAVHARLLEGAEAFARRFAIEPDPASIEGLIRTVDELKSALQERGAPPPPAKARKSDLLEYARLYLQGVPVWDLILDEWAQANQGKEAITRAEADELELMASLAAQEPNMVAVMAQEEGVQLAELSVLWTLPDGVRCRYRFDALVPSGNVDLKSVGNAIGSFKEAVGRQIRTYALDVQLAQSFEARKAAYELIQKRAIFGGTKEQRAWLRRFPTHAPLNAGTEPGWSWLWVFYQRPDPKAGRAPTILPLVVPYGDDLHRDGYRKAQLGLERYREAVRLFGLDKPWTELLPVHAVSGNHSAVLQLPPDWGAPAMRAPGEDQALAWRL